MKVLFIHETFSDKSFVSEMKEIPRIGDNVMLFHHPYPTVTKVIWTFDTELSTSIEEGSLRTIFRSYDVVIFVK